MRVHFLAAVSLCVLKVRHVEHAEPRAHEHDALLGMPLNWDNFTENLLRAGERAGRRASVLDGWSDVLLSGSANGPPAATPPVTSFAADSRSDKEAPIERDGAGGGDGDSGGLSAAVRSGDLESDRCNAPPAAVPLKLTGDATDDVHAGHSGGAVSHCAPSVERVVSAESHSGESSDASGPPASRAHTRLLGSVSMAASSSVHARRAASPASPFARKYGSAAATAAAADDEASLPSFARWRTALLGAVRDRESEGEVAAGDALPVLYTLRPEDEKESHAVRRCLDFALFKAMARGHKLLYGYMMAHLASIAIMVCRRRGVKCGGWVGMGRLVVFLDITACCCLPNGALPRGPTHFVPFDSDYGSCGQPSSPCDAECPVAGYDHGCLVLV